MSSTQISQADILDRLILPNRGDLSPDAARSILAIRFSNVDLQRMRELSQKANEGMLTAEDEIAADNYERIGNLLGLLHSKARLSLNKLTGNS